MTASQSLAEALNAILQQLARDQQAGRRDYSWLMDEILDAEYALRAAGHEPTDWAR